MTPQFCPLCDVSLDLHSGPGTCHIAAQKEFVIGLAWLLPNPSRREPEAGQEESW